MGAKENMEDLGNYNNYVPQKHRSPVPGLVGNKTEEERTSGHRLL